MNRDYLGVLCQRQPDGLLECGDGVRWTGDYIYLRNLITYPFRRIFEVGFGGYTRHPDPAFTDNGFGSHYKNPWTGCISRDQLIGIIAALIATKDYVGAVRYMLHRACNLFLFSYNSINNGEDPGNHRRKGPDFTGPTIWACELRMLGWFSYVFYPILCVLDLLVLVDTISHNKQINAHVISFLMRYLICTDRLLTPFGYIAKKILNKEVMHQRLVAYWKGWRQQPEMVQLYMEKL